MERGMREEGERNVGTTLIVLLFEEGKQIIEHIFVSSLSIEQSGEASAMREATIV
jgi:hypothetical protein